MVKTDETTDSVPEGNVSPGVINLELHLYKPHPFPNPMQGDILEVEDDATVAPTYFIVMATVLMLLIILSAVLLVMFVLIVKWTRRRAVQESNPRVSNNSASSTG